MNRVKPSIAELKDACAGQAVAVLGGGPSLPGDLRRIATPATATIAVNFHALKIIIADYMAFLDDPADEYRRPLREWIDTVHNYDLRTRLISPVEKWSDYVVSGHWDPGFTSGYATWLACYMGGDPVLLCGMDCYQGKWAYFYRRKGANEHPAVHYPLEMHLNAWRPALDHCPNSHRIRAMSGPLTDIFGEM